MKTISRHFQLTIARKLLLGFLSCGILGVLFALIALSNFQKLNEINNQIIERDVPLAETANEMVEALIGQDLYGRRSLILKSSDMEGLFWKRSNEFEMLQRKIAGLPDPPALSLHRLATAHKEYNSLYEAEFDKKDLSSSTSRDDQLMRGKREELFELLKGISQNARKDQNEKNLETRSIGDSAFWTVLGLSIGGLLLGIFIAVLITHNISGSIRLLEHSTREISEGKFNQVSQVRTRDELGDLSRAFQMMAQRLKQAEEERERLIQSLRDSLAKIKRLQGMLPICASCKRIRDGQGYWKEIEAYIHEHSEAEFTHGLCPDCVRKLYGISIDKGDN